MAITYLKKSPKTSSTDDTKTREIVENILKDIEKTKEEGCKAPVSYTHLRAHETPEHLVCRLMD